MRIVRGPGQSQLNWPKESQACNIRSAEMLQKLLRGGRRRGLPDVAAALRDFGQKFQAIERAISYRESIEPVGLVRCREYADWMGYSITDEGMQAVGRRLSSIGNTRRMKCIFERRGEGEYRLWPVAFLQEWDAVFRANLVDAGQPLAIEG